jgi:hypothetical protein
MYVTNGLSRRCMVPLTATNAVRCDATVFMRQ